MHLISWIFDKKSFGDAWHTETKKTIAVIHLSQRSPERWARFSGRHFDLMSQAWRWKHFPQQLSFKISVELPFHPHHHQSVLFRFITLWRLFLRLAIELRRCWLQSAFQAHVNARDTKQKKSPNQFSQMQMWILMTIASHSMQHWTNGRLIW